MKSKKIVLIVAGIVILISGISFTAYYVFIKYFDYRKSAVTKDDVQKTDSQKNTAPTTTDTTPAYTLTSYSGEVFGAKVPKGWTIIDNESGIDIIDNTDSNTGASGAIAVGWQGSQTPDGFIDFMLNAIGAQDVAYENESAQEEITDPNYGLKWQMKTRTFTFTKDGTRIKAKASAGVLNGYGQFMGMITAFQTTPDKWAKWAPTLERIAQSITIINASKAGGIDKVRLPTAADLKNDSSPIMESWEYRNKVTDRASHEFSDAIMGQETDLYSPSSGQSYTQPLSNYDPTIGGYRNPDNSSETLVDPYE